MFKRLTIGDFYSKGQISSLIEEPNLLDVREGIFYSKNSPSTVLFVNLDKSSQKKEHLRFDDFFEGEFFHWDTQPKQHVDTPRIREIVDGSRSVYLFARIKDKIRGRTQPYVYCGQMEFSEHESGTRNPAHLVFRNIDYQDETENENLKALYFWKPGDVGQSKHSKVDKSRAVSPDRKRKYKKPSQTERSGLVVSRVGQGYYRQQVLEKWKGTCAVTGCKIQSILIASHIVPWSQSTEDERLDPENGILLSPNVDGLFDRHLISISNAGEILPSSKIGLDELALLGIDVNSRISVTPGMLPYLSRHRKVFEDTN